VLARSSRNKNAAASQPRDVAQACAQRTMRKHALGVRRPIGRQRLAELRPAASSIPHRALPNLIPSQDFCLGFCI